jgi:CRISPR-associated protein Csc3
MIQVALLEQAVDATDDLLRAFVRYAAPGLIRDYSLLTAKGGRFADERRAEGIEVEHFDRDQSMLTHLLNGIFPTMRLLRLLEERSVRHLSNAEKQVYLLAYCMHDLDKVLKQQPLVATDVVLPKGGLDTHERAAIDAVAAETARQIEALGLAAFFPTYRDYLDDIVFLAVNTQKSRSTHLNSYLFRFGLKERQLSVLRQLCAYSDVIAYLVQSPSEIVYGRGANALREGLAFISQDTLAFAYHKMKDVRGLLTNVLNNSVTHLLQEQGVLPYLFFPDGVVYLMAAGTTLEVDRNRLAQAARDELVRVCQKRIAKDKPGFKFDPKGLVKKPDYYHDFLSAAQYVRLIAEQSVSMTTRDISVSPAEKLQEMKVEGLVPADIDVAFEPDTRLGVLARFLINLWKEVLERIPDKLTYDRLTKQVLERLELTELWKTAERIPGKGGVEYKWFWLAAKYLAAHPGADTQQGVGNLRDLFDEIVASVLPEAEPYLEKTLTGHYMPHVGPYLAETLAIYPSPGVAEPLPDFVAELEQYASAKRPRKATLICTMCHSAYPTAQQEDAAVLFQPWVYKNKLPLYAGSNAGGVCALCSLELMLRQIMLKGDLRLTGSKFEGLRTKYFYLYPAYFFTTETAQFVRFFVERFKFINFFEVRKQLRTAELTPTDFLNLDTFLVSQDSLEEIQDSGYLKMEYPPYSFPALVFFGMKAGGKDSDSEAWAMPAFLALTLPLVLNVKTVVSESPVPLFASGADFKETVVIDGPHPYLRHLLTADRLRLDDLLDNLVRLTGVYTLNIDTFAKPPRPEWNHLVGVARKLETDPLYVFAYLRQQQRSDSLYRNDASRYIQLFERIGGNMSLIKGCVDRYSVFYGGGFKTHSILKPVDIVAKAIIASDKTIDSEDLKFQIRGELASWLDRVRNRQAEGWAKFRGKEIDTQELPAVREFVEYFCREVFEGYCRGERGLLRSRINRFKDGCEAYYVEKRATDKAEHEAVEKADVIV